LSSTLDMSLLSNMTGYIPLGRRAIVLLPSRGLRGRRWHTVRAEASLRLGCG